MYTFIVFLLPGNKRQSRIAAGECKWVNHVLHIHTHETKWNSLLWHLGVIECWTAIVWNYCWKYRVMYFKLCIYITTLQDWSVQKNVQMYSRRNMLPWTMKIFEAVLFSKSAHVWWWNYTNVLCSVQNVCLPTTSNQHPLPSSAAVRCVTRDLPDTWNTPSSVWVSLYITQSLHANLTTHPL